MTALTRPRHPIVADALSLARDWCAGHIIDSAPALGHAVKVALVLDRHLPAAAPELVAAVLLHDSPEYAPPGIDLDAVLTARFGPFVTAVVRGLQREHIALDRRSVPDVTAEDRRILHASAADKIVSLGAILRRAARSADPAAFWRTRAAFAARVPYFAAFHAAAEPHLPPAMSRELAHLVARAQRTAPELERRTPVRREELQR